MIHAASHVDHEERTAWFSMPARGSVPTCIVIPVVMWLCLAAL